jgi:hypothetical protein
MAFSYKDYQESDRVKKLAERLAQLESQKPGDWTGGQYGQQMQEALDAIRKRKKFSYDLNGDALYQQYKDKYVQQGKQAMQDTMGQAAALTGGYASTYGQAVGQQQYDAYLQQLNDVVPELYQMAYQQYQDEGDRMQQQYGMLGDLADDEYSKYRDAYNQWLTERDYAQGNADTAYDRGYNQWLQQWNQFNTDRNYQLEKENADRQYQLQLEQFRWQQEQAAQAAAAAKSSGGGSSSGGSGGSKNTGSSSYKDTTAYSRALAYAKAGAQSRRTANLLNGFVQRGEITAAQAEQIMNELY